jgi:hypothetical protein
LLKSRLEAMQPMSGIRTWHYGALVAALTALGISRPARAISVNLSEDEFKTYFEYLDALQDERVQKLRPSQKLPSVARNFHMTPAKLKGIVDKGQQWPTLAAMGKDAEEAIRSAVAGTTLDGRLDMVDVDVGNQHVVSYVSWIASDLDKTPEEAVLLASKVKTAAPISADIRIWAEDPKDKTHKVFDGLILGEAAGRFQPARITDFARTRYIKAFQFARTDPPQPDLPQSGPPPGATPQDAVADGGSVSAPSNSPGGGPAGPTAGAQPAGAHAP